MAKKVVVGFCALVVLFVVGCATAPAIPDPQPGDPPYLHFRAATGGRGVVAAARPEASQVGVDILRRGGNAVDAAVAVGFALGVIEPHMSGIGGGGFMTIKLVDMPEPIVLDFREPAPGASTPQMFLGPDGAVVPGAQTTGGLAVGTPAHVAGFLYALENFGSGRLTRQQVMQPAIHYAENGFVVREFLSQQILAQLNRINTFPATSAIFTDGGLPLEVGYILRQPDLAHTLRLIAEGGADAFYSGPLAGQIVQAVQDTGGIMTLSDLAQVRVRRHTPITGTYRGYTIISMPPPSSGGMCIVQILNMLENLDPSYLRFGETQAVHAWLQAFRISFADRDRWMADTDFVNVPLEGLTSKEYARELFARFNPNVAMLTAEAGNPIRFESNPAMFQSGSSSANLESDSTTSFSIMDRAGNAVTVTVTLNLSFGSAVTVPGTGIILNNQMASGFNPVPGTIHSPEPYKRGLSSMSPTIVLDPQGRPFMTLGTPGATRIFPTVAQIISHVIDNNMPIQEALNMPRWFTMETGQVHVENRLPESTIQGLIDMGYDVNVRPGWDPFFGGVHAVLFDHTGEFGRRGRLHGAADPRRDGFARAF
jgi:gamma-glutamyltranspeptidase/glutathione hydrolase